MMAIVGFTRTQADIPAPTDPYHRNDNTVLTPFSGFWGGDITSNIGAFSQVTYNAPGPVSSLSGTPADQFLHTWTWDNTDVRFSNRPFRLTRFQTIHHHSGDVARGLVLLFDGGAIGQRHHGADTRGRHQAPAHLIVSHDG